MSATGRSVRITTRDLRSRDGEMPIAALTAYTTPMAHLLDPHCDLLLVVGAAVTEAVQAYAADVRARRLPGPEHTHG